MQRKKTMITIKSRNLTTTFCGLILAMASFDAKLQAGAYFYGEAGSYAASESGQLAGGQTLTDWTIELWVKPDSLSTYQGLFDNHQNWKELSIWQSPSGAFGMLVTWPYTYTGGESSAGVISPNQWQLLSVVGDGSEMRLYVNGNLVGTGITPGQASFGAVYTPGWTLGTFNFGLSDLQTLPDVNFFKGSLADFRVWDRALDPSELVQHVTVQPTLSELGLRNWIPFNETSGDVFYDIVGNQNGKYYNVGLSSDSPFSSVPEPSTYLTGVWAMSIIGMFVWKNRKQLQSSVLR